MVLFYKVLLITLHNHEFLTNLHLYFDQLNQNLIYL